MSFRISLLSTFDFFCEQWRIDLALFIGRMGERGSESAREEAGDEKSYGLEIQYWGRAVCGDSNAHILYIHPFNPEPYWGAKQVDWQRHQSSSYPHHKQICGSLWNEAIM